MTQVCVIVFVAVVVAGCSPSEALRDRMREIQGTIASAEENGAMKCAPRELAVAQSAIEFAKLDESHGDLSSAWAHMSEALPNAQAALSLSPADRCRASAAPR